MRSALAPSDVQTSLVVCLHQASSGSPDSGSMLGPLLKGRGRDGARAKLEAGTGYRRPPRGRPAASERHHIDGARLRRWHRRCSGDWAGHSDARSCWLVRGRSARRERLRTGRHGDHDGDRRRGCCCGQRGWSGRRPGRVRCELEPATRSTSRLLRFHQPERQASLAEGPTVSFSPIRSSDCRMELR